MIKRMLHLGALIALPASQVSASLFIDLRFGDGSHTNYPFPEPGSITFNAWAVVTGQPGNANPEGLQSAVFAVKTVIENGSGIVGGITSASLATGWNGSGSQVGTTSNITNDGVGDWGNASNASLFLSTSHLRVRTTKSVNNPIDWGDGDSPIGSEFNLLPDGGREFKVATFTFSWTSFPSGSYPNLSSIHFVPVTVLGGTPVPAGWYEDTLDKTAGAPTGSKSPSTGTFGPANPNSSQLGSLFFGVVPEPASISLLLIPAMALKRRRGTDC